MRALFGFAGRIGLELSGAFPFILVELANLVGVFALVLEVRIAV